MEENPVCGRLIKQVQKLEADLKRANLKILEQQRALDGVARHDAHDPCGSDGGRVTIGRDVNVLPVGASEGARKRETGSAHGKISEVTVLDGLTGLYHRRFFMEALERERARAERHHKALSLCRMDLDSFERVNEKLGPAAGAFVLTDVSEILRKWSRRTDLLCRYGEEKFAVILPETDMEGARVACERLRRMVAENRFQWRTGPFQMTLSIGIARNRTGHGDSIRKLIDRADEALYRAKSTGGNRVKVRNGGSD